MTRLFTLLILTACSGGCARYTFVHAPGATGRLIDPVNNVWLSGARITRPAMMSQRDHDLALPSITVHADKNGNFDLPPFRESKWVFIYRRNPYSITSSFLVTADGYTTNELHGVATSRISWRVEFGEVILRKP